MLRSHQMTHDNINLNSNITFMHVDMHTISALQIVYTYITETYVEYMICLIFCSSDFCFRSKCVGVPQLHTGQTQTKPWHCPPGPCALCLLAPECGPWGRVARGTTMRSVINPLGAAIPYVENSNLHTSRPAPCSHM